MPAAAGSLPRDQTLGAIAGYLTGPAMHTVAKLAFFSAAVAFAISGN
jgi:type IV secretory pathway VirB2 component (pilin)